MRFRTLIAIGGAAGMIGVVAGLVVESLSGADDSTEAAFILAGLSIVASMAVIGFLAGWFGRERDDVAITSIGAGIVAAVALVIASASSEEVVIASVAIAGGVTIVGGVAGVVAWWIGSFICDARDLPTASRLVAPAYSEDLPGYPMWTTDAGPAIRATLDDLADRVAPGESISGRAVGIVVRLPRDLPVVVLLAGGRLLIQPVDINGGVDGDLVILHGADITEVSIRSMRADGTERKMNAYRDVITIGTASGSDIRLLLPYGTRGVGTTTGGPDVIREWLTARSGLDR
jgi:hypothetical protein